MLELPPRRSRVDGVGELLGAARDLRGAGRQRPGPGVQLVQPGQTVDQLQYRARKALTVLREAARSTAA